MPGMDLRARASWIAGEWKGVKRLWLMPEDPVRESEATASLELVAGGGFAAIRYTWSHEDRPHDGLLVVRLAEAPGDEDMVWVDSFHTGGSFMRFGGVESPATELVGQGTYAAPPGPDWGWRIALAAESLDGLRILMHNITPAGEESKAVQLELRRANATE